MKAVYRGPAGILVIDGTRLVRDGEPVELTPEQVERLQGDATVRIEVVETTRPRRRRGADTADAADIAIEEVTGDGY